MAVRPAAARLRLVPRGRVALRLRRASEDHLRRQAVDVGRILDVLRNAVTLFALERATVCAPLQMRLVRADTNRRDIAIARRVEWWCRVLVTAVAGLAVACHVIDDAVHVALGGNEMPV